VLGVLVLGALLASGATGLRGSIEGRIRIAEGPELGVDLLNVTLGLVGDGWRTTTRTQFTDRGFTYFGVADERKFGSMHVRTLVVFNPDDSAFSYLSSLAQFALESVRFANYAYIGRTPSAAYDQLTARWSIGGVSWRGTIRSGLCPVAFRTASLDAAWQSPSCDLAFDAQVAFAAETGFEHFRLTGRRSGVPMLTTEAFQTDLSLEIRWGIDEKRIIPDLRVRTLRSTTCFTPFFRLRWSADPFSISAVEMYGWAIEFSTENGAEILLATSLDPAANREITDYEEYFERWRVRWPLSSCGDRSGRIEVSLYFDAESNGLFQWGRTTAAVELPIGRAVTLRWGGTFQSVSPRWALTAGWELSF